ncbi:tRNA epoxyqueuosine(34) reductase QueG [Methylotenera sp.]|uniref:tRNA epoxyqueuosine(34) reductase QueG n=3 Tax=Methylotenera sp. TaxID=2051956 RepID=UPI002716ED8F|nr:tRNA epoxyqueuosine(34) reductase QueG [Methylotenera sp.]MDO9204444.1 tRNA epoxyqueuosine(34) reductase QueG [Methylotenera sp.]MDP3819558.1 tRNA epoxyqueuosine(34) reductase QueG [Methylotenera sp.]
MKNPSEFSQTKFTKLSDDIKQWGLALGFNQVGITDTNLHAAEAEHQAWIAKGFHGEMDYMAKHGVKRTRPAELVPNTLRVISARLDYFPVNTADSASVLQDGSKAFISRYALGRDYHRVMRNKLQKLCEKIQSEITQYQVDDFSYRVFTDSAPVLEVALAEKASLGWRGKHTLLINKDRGSWFFLGEIYTNLPLTTDQPASNHCGTCTNCMDVCPTQAITAPYEIDARRCISYLTIELKGSIPLELRPLIGNRVYGCDDCQIFCPWNKFAETTDEPDFAVRNGLDNISLVQCFAWTESDFKKNMAGSAIYRIGYEQWLRNIAVGLGNAQTTTEIVSALQSRIHDSSILLREHIDWALARHLTQHHK